jgi:TetR/AcrR family tetracycline transcriptional repressor
MAKVRRDEVVMAALKLLDEVGLERLSTRRLAERLGVESPTLYWHFRDKQALLSEMSAMVVAMHHNAPIPEELERWPEWFAENARAFRKTLMSVRDGARLHAGSRPDANEMTRIVPKLDYLVRCGIPRHEALMAMMAAGQFTLGCVMEEQSRPHEDESVHMDERPLALKALDDLAETIHRANPGGDAAFEFGLNLIIMGLADRFNRDAVVKPAARRPLAGRRKGPTKK